MNDSSGHPHMIDGGVTTPVEKLVSYPVLFINVDESMIVFIFFFLLNIRPIPRNIQKMMIINNRGFLYMVKPSICFPGFIIRDEIHIESLNSIILLDSQFDVD